MSLDQFCLLYLLQLATLSYLATAHLDDQSNLLSQVSTQTSTSPSSGFSATESPLQGNHINLYHNQQPVKMKTVSMKFLMKHLSTMSSLQDFVSLFIKQDDVDSHRNRKHRSNRWISRTLQSKNDDTNGHGRRFSLDIHKAKIQSSRYPAQNTGFYDVRDDDESRSNPGDSWPETGSVFDEEVDDVTDEEENTSDYVQDDSKEGDLEAFEAALHHLDEVRSCSSSRCKQPTPFVLSMRDTHDNSRVYIPDCVVLHRCMNFSGCCGDSDHECVPKSTSIVRKSFLVVHRLSADDDHVTFHSKMATTVSFVNHTECMCREKVKPPKCNRKCPKPLRLNQDGGHCVCDCFPLVGVDSRPCESIKAGIRALSDEGLVCVKNGNCYIPKCSVGEMDITTGLCPLSDDYALPAFLFDDPNDRRYYRDHLHGYGFYNLPGKITSTYKSLNSSLTPPSTGRALAQQDNQDDFASKKTAVDSTQAKNKFLQLSSQDANATPSDQPVHYKPSFNEQASPEDYSAVSEESNHNYPQWNFVNQQHVNDFQSWHPSLFDDVSDENDNDDQVSLSEDKRHDENDNDDLFSSPEEKRQADSSPNTDKNVSDDFLNVQNGDTFLTHSSTTEKVADTPVSAKDVGDEHVDDEDVSDEHISNEDVVHEDFGHAGKSSNFGHEKYVATTRLPVYQRDLVKSHLDIFKHISKIPFVTDGITSQPVKVTTSKDNLDSALSTKRGFRAYFIERMAGQEGDPGRKLVTHVSTFSSLPSSSASTLLPLKSPPSFITSTPSPYTSSSILLTSIAKSAVASSPSSLISSILYQPSSSSASTTEIMPNYILFQETHINSDTHSDGSGEAPEHNPS